MLVETIKESQQQYRQAGLSQGVARQWQQGVEKGATDVARSILQRQLQRRFGHVPPHIEAQLNAARQMAVLKGSGSFFRGALLPPGPKRGEGGNAEKKQVHQQFFTESVSGAQPLAQVDGTDQQPHHDEPQGRAATPVGAAE